jgi:mannose-6-phosphate isomerase-like protein (cupin superfamily)
MAKDYCSKNIEFLEPSDKSYRWGTRHILSDNQVLHTEILDIKKGKKLDFQYHLFRTSVFYVVAGIIVLTTINNGREETFMMHKGHSFTVNKGIAYKLGGGDINNIIYATSHAHYDDDVYVIKNGD